MSVSKAQSASTRVAGSALTIKIGTPSRVCGGYLVLEEQLVLTSGEQ